MAQQVFIRIGVLLFATTFIVSCMHTTHIGQPFMTVPHPGKYQLAYHTPSQEFPLHSMATVDGREFLVIDDVVLPSVQSLYLLTHWKIFDGASVVVATDINPAAIKMAKLNAQRNGADNIIDVRQGEKNLMSFYLILIIPTMRQPRDSGNCMSVFLLK